jgi:hypothetical protein
MPFPDLAGRDGEQRFKRTFKRVLEKVITLKGILVRENLLGDCCVGNLEVGQSFTTLTINVWVPKA